MLIIAWDYDDNDCIVVEKTANSNKHQQVKDSNAFDFINGWGF